MLLFLFFEYNFSCRGEHCSPASDKINPGVKTIQALFTAHPYKNCVNILMLVNYMELPVRKPNRLKKFDYSSDGLYFITICTANHENIFWKNINEYVLSEYGEIAGKAVLKINKVYENNVVVDNYVIMPNHIHLIIVIHNNLVNDGRAMLAPTISHIIQQFKGIVTKKAGFSVWQKSFHDHIIRTQKEYQEITKYIEEWELDCFYIKNGYNLEE